ncbi:MAG: DUF5685 family protein [Myxococcota bacterium]
MFGTLAPPRCGNALPVVRTHRSFYCGTFKSLGEHFGQARRALLSHDAVFIAVLVDALQTTPAPPSRCRCPMMPTAFRSTVAHDSVAMRYAASMQMLLADQWLADRAVDGETAARWARPLVSRRPAREAEATLVELGADLAAVKRFELRQAAIESTGRPLPAVAASPTAAVLAAVFETMADLPGTADGVDTAEARERLATLGAAVGTAIYLIDALEDLHDDVRSADFNACTDEDGAPCPDRVASACTLLRESFAEIDGALAGLPLARHRELLHAILHRQLGARGHKAMAAAHAQLTASAQAALAHWRTLTPTRRLMIRMMTAVALLWTWAMSRVTQAAPARGGSDESSSSGSSSSSGGSSDSSGSTGGSGDEAATPPDLGSQGSGTGAGPEPDTDPSAVGCGDPCGDLGSGCARPCNRCFEGCGSCFESGGDCFAGCGSCGTDCGSCFGDCGNGCSGCGNDCGNGCASCGDGCGDGCNGCSGCGDGCSSCGDGCSTCGSDCGGCGNSCSGCGSGCSGCGSGCGQGCNGCGGGGAACC